MVGKTRVSELAKELDITPEELLDVLRQEGIEAASGQSAIEDDMAELIRIHVADNKAKPTKKPARSDAAIDDEDDGDADPEADTSGKGKGKGGKGKGKGGKGGKKGYSDRAKVPASSPDEDTPGGSREIHLKAPFVVKDLADAMGLRPNSLIQELMMAGVFASINESLDAKTAEQIAEKHGFELVAEKRGKGSGDVFESDLIAPEEVEFENAATQDRPPVVTMLGHVDHGKTSLLDRIRDTHVVDGEAGGITQHIGASQVESKGRKITFIDTPGHEAFTQMRARGANATDIVILVVAADDGFMPQTVEALSHAKAAKVPIIVAVNKIDLPGANPDKILLQMQQNGITSEDWGGDIGVVRVSAHTGEGIDTLLERITLESEMLELKANPDLPVRAIVLESQLEQGLGPTVNVLVKNGTISQGDTVICGQNYGRVKALIDSRGRRVKKAGPSEAVKVVGLSGLPESGAILAGCDDERQAKKLASERTDRDRVENLTVAPKASLEDLFAQIEEDARKDLRVVVKADVQGTAEAVIESLHKLDSEKIKVEVVHSGVGAITENDILLAAASNALIIGFHVRVNPGVNKVAKEQGVEIRLYSIIYELLEQVRDAMEGMLAPTIREIPVGQAEILKIFNLTKGKICGCMATQGKIRVGSHARVHRGEDLIYNGTIASLRRFQDDVKEVDNGLECGIRLDNFTDFEVGDKIEVYDYKEEKTKL